MTDRHPLSEQSGSELRSKRLGLAKAIMALGKRAEEVASDASYAGTEDQVALLLSVAGELRTTARKAAYDDGPMVGLVH